jgi:glutamyl-tRNA reductase
VNLQCIGINHRTADLPVRESVWFSDQELPAALAALRREVAGECVLISTCNRTELYLTVDDNRRGVGENGRAVDDHRRSAEGNGNPGNPNRPIWALLAALKPDSTAGAKNFYALEGLEAVEQLFKVVSGIDSMVIGDVQINGQVRDAHAAAAAAGTSGTMLNRLFHSALHVGKRARSETQIGAGAISVSYLAAELATKIFADLSKRSALLVGAGETGKLAAKHLLSRSLGGLVIANRTRESAERVAAEVGARVIDFESIPKELAGVDIVLTAVAADRFILKHSDVSGAMSARGNRPLIVIDLGVPRNVDPGVNVIENVFLHDLDALNTIIAQNLGHRESEVPKVERIIEEELAAFREWHGSIDLTPTIAELRERFESIRGAEVERMRHKLPPAEIEEVEMLTKRIVNKILHTPMTNLKNGHSSEETRTKISFIRHLFGLDK